MTPQRSNSDNIKVSNRSQVRELKPPLSLNVCKTKEVIIHFRSVFVDLVDCFKFLTDLQHSYTDCMLKKTQQRYFLSRLQRHVNQNFCSILFVHY